MSAGRRIAAVMWTYGRADVVAEGVRALLAQTYPLEQVVVVDSASPDDTADRLREMFGDRVTVLELADNLGPGAAIAAAFEHLEPTDLSDVWLVEDDSRPAADCLAQLVSIADTVPPPAMIGPDGAYMRRGQWRPQPRLPEGAIAAVDFVYLDGALLSAEVVHELDGPRRDYFVMMLDVEYPLRFAGSRRGDGAGRGALRVAASRCHGGRAPWRAYYQTRNHLHLAVSHRSPALLGGFVLRTAKHTAYAIGTGSWDQLAYRRRGVADAIRGRMGRTVEPPSAHPTRSQQPTDAHTSILLGHTYSADFDDALRSFLATRGGDRVDGAPRQRPAQPDGSLRVLDAVRADPPHGRTRRQADPRLRVRVGHDHAVARLAREGSGGLRRQRRAVAITRARLREHGLEHVTVHHAESYRDVADQLGSFDLVVAHAVFEHVPLSVPGLRADVIRQAFDAVAPGGHLFISESPNRLMPRDIYCTGLWFIPWTKGGSTWAYRRAIRTGRHTDPDGRGPISLEERGAWGFTYWTVRRVLRRTTA